MPVKFTQAILTTLKPSAKAFDLTDSGQKGLVLRVRPSGVHTWLVRLGYGRLLVLGRMEDLSPEAARRAAHSKIEEDRGGHDPIVAKRQQRAAAKAERRQQAADAMTFNKFLSQKYEPWARAHLKSLASTVRAMELQFSPVFGDQPLTAITPEAIETWRTGRLTEERRAPHTPNRSADTRLPGQRIKPVTVNKELAALKAALSRAVEWGYLEAHPLRKVRPLRHDRHGGIVRYLTRAERKRLYAALTARDDTRRAARDHANEFRRERGYELLPAYPTRGYTDHLRPLVLLLLNTGMRRGEALKLTWGDVNFVSRLLTVRGGTSKSGQTRYIPMTDEARRVLRTWRPTDPEPAPDALVFPGADDDVIFSLKSAWRTLMKAAAIDGFRMHDCRHDFASRLVQAGVSLYEVKTLLGHSSIELTERYSHLAGDNLAAAVAKLRGTR